ncbi:hypothetical protein BU16DRAFT_133394 [Lophium mytilinum]|uniref:BTB domain-containing protein n=1 Tax=Lophium mytilinum TaxID=390894 RepID=A0A6A6QGH7_9PEZI|nr:hypothetical protein BU16DRAFT_133394 [Lophium mytilinum]
MASSTGAMKTRGPSPITVGGRIVNLVNLKVGSEERIYPVNEDLLAYHSEYFRVLFKGPFREAKEKVSALPDIQCRTFEIFRDWLCSGRFPWEGSMTGSVPNLSKLRGYTAELALLAAHEHRAAEEIASDDDMENVEEYALDLFILADTYDIPRLRLDALISFFIVFAQDSTKTPSSNSIMLAVDCLPEGSPMRTIISDLFCVRVMGADLPKDYCLKLPDDFMFDVLKKMKDMLLYSLYPQTSTYQSFVAGHAEVRYIPWRRKPIRQNSPRMPRRKNRRPRLRPK